VDIKTTIGRERDRLDRFAFSEGHAQRVDRVTTCRYPGQSLGIRKGELSNLSTTMEPSKQNDTETAPIISFKTGAAFSGVEFLWRDIVYLTIMLATHQFILHYLQLLYSLEGHAYRRII
jgi:hypothetical protein